MCMWLGVAKDLSKDARLILKSLFCRATCAKLVFKSKSIRVKELTDEM